MSHVPLWADDFLLIKTIKTKSANKGTSQLWFYKKKRSKPEDRKFKPVCLEIRPMILRPRSYKFAH